VCAAAADHRLYMPAFTRTKRGPWSARRYRPASPSRVDEILALLRPLEESIRATSKLDNLAIALDASTWPLAALHAQPQTRPWRAFEPRETARPRMGQPIHQSAADASLPGAEYECTQSPRTCPR